MQKNQGGRNRTHINWTQIKHVTITPHPKIIQRQVPLPLPCYDLAAIKDNAFTGCINMVKNLLHFIKNIIEISISTYKSHQCPPLSPFAAWRAVCTRVLGNSPLHGDKRLLAIPPSCFQVSENNSNFGRFSRFASTHIVASHCNGHCSKCVAQFVSYVQTWRHPHFKLY